MRKIVLWDFDGVLAGGACTAGLYSKLAKFIQGDFMKVNDREFTVVIEKDEDGYFVGSVPELHGCHSQAKSIDELMKRMREVIELCLSESTEPIPRPSSFVGVQRIKVRFPHVRLAPS